jgi:hypothetical protein
MSDPRDSNTTHLGNGTKQPWLFAAGLALLIGFGAGWTSGRVASEQSEPPEPPLAAARRLPRPPTMPSPMEGQLLSPAPLAQTTDAQTTDSKAGPSTAGSIE